MVNLERRLDFLELFPGIGIKIAINNFENGRDTIPVRQNQTFQDAYRKSFVFGMYHAVSVIALSYVAFHYASKLL